MYYRIPITPIPKLVAIYCIERSTTWRCADENNMLVFIKQGCCYFNVNSEEHLLKEGEAIFIPANTPYTRRAYEKTNCTFYYVHFFADPLPSVVSKESMASIASELLEIESLGSGENSYTPKSFSDIFLANISDFSNKKEEIFTILDNILNNDFKPNNPYGHFNASLSLAKLLSIFSYSLLKNINTETYHDSSTLPHVLQKALSYIRKNRKKKISVSTLATIAGVSQQHLIRLFNQHLKMTPVKYINRSKIFHAIDMLRYTEMSIKEIAYELGFDNPNYFSRLFTQEEGCSPSEIRDRIKNYKDGPGALIDTQQT